MYLIKEDDLLKIINDLASFPYNKIANIITFLSNLDKLETKTDDKDIKVQEVKKVKNV